MKWIKVEHYQLVGLAKPVSWSFDQECQGIFDLILGTENPSAIVNIFDPIGRWWWRQVVGFGIPKRCQENRLTTIGWNRRCFQSLSLVLIFLWSQWVLRSHNIAQKWVLWFWDWWRLRSCKWTFFQRDSFHFFKFMFAGIALGSRTSCHSFSCCRFSGWRLSSLFGSCLVQRFIYKERSILVQILPKIPVRWL